MAAECGTRNGYRAHLYRREDPCGPCNDANNAHGRAYRSVRTRAIKKLIARHRGEYARLLADETAKEATQ